MNLQKNIRLAEDTVAFVKKHVRIGAANRIDNPTLLLVPALPVLCVAAHRVLPVTKQAETLELPPWIADAAAKSKAMGCGNCGEQAALAYVHLLKSVMARPVDYMVRSAADHAFVVIGRAADSNAWQPKTWGAAAVVCDPWNDEAYAASDIEARMYRSLAERTKGNKSVVPTSLARAD